MAVLTVKKYKYVKDENGNKIRVEKTKEEWDKETKKGTAIYYFSDRYELNGKKVPYRSRLFEKKRDAEADRGLFLNDPIKYIQEHSKRAKNRLKLEKETEELKNLDEYYMEYFEYDLSINKESTAYDHKNNYFKHVSPILGKYKPSEINMSSIDDFHLKIDKKELSHNTKININSSLSSFLEYLKLKSKIELNYAKAYGTFKQANNDIIEEKKVKYQTTEEFNFFMQIIDDLFWQAFYNFAFWHGLRKGEQQALRWKDINFEKEEVKINKTVSKSKTGGITIVTTKNRKNRTIYLAKQTIEFLRKLKQFCQNLPKFNENWFVFGKGESITDVIARNTIDRHLKKQYNKLKEKFPQKKINILTHHEFGRHSHASYLLSIGATLPDIYRIIAIRLGDTEEVIKNTYAHPYEDENNDKTRKLLNS